MVAIFVLSLFILMLSIDILVLKTQGKSHPAFETIPSEIDVSLVPQNLFAVPSDVLLSNGHTWVKHNKEGLLNVGIDAFGNTALGDLSIIGCPENGIELTRGDVIFEGTYGNKKVKFLSPVSGIVESINSTVIGKKLFNPYNEWAVKILPKEGNLHVEGFLTGNNASTWMKKEFIKLKNFLESNSQETAIVGATMYDGGSLSKDVHIVLSDKSVTDFEKEFLSL